MDLNTKAKIVDSSAMENFIKLERWPRENADNVYEISVYSLCKLVDGLSKGNFVQYLDCFIMNDPDMGICGFGVGAPETVEKISKYLITRLDKVDRDNLFGTGVKLDTLDDYKKYFNHCRGYRKDDAAKEIRRYINDNFDLVGKSFQRKIGKHYINV